MKRLLIILTFLYWANTCFAQQDSFHLIRSFSGHVADAALDNLDNLYVLTTTDQLKKYNSRGDSLAVYNNVRNFGKVHAIDVSNPLKVLLYYKDFSSIVILDRLLSVRATIDLRRRQIMKTTAIGLSYDSNIWLFDAFDNKLKKIGEEGNLLLETPDFRTLFQESVLPHQIIDQNNLLYLYDSTQGVYVFDRYGTFKRKVPVRGWNTINITDKFIFGITGSNSLRSYNLSTLMESQYRFPGNFTPYYRYNLASNKLIAIAKDSIHIYHFR